MKISQLALASTIALASFSSQANNTPYNANDGTIHFKGVISAATCNIELASANQEIDFGQISAARFNSQHQSSPQIFNIKLKDCNTTDAGKKNTIKITFNGNSVDNENNKLTTDGQTNTAVQIADDNGTMIKFGNESQAIPLNNQDMSLEYSAWITKNDPAKPVIPGEFNATVNFNLNYE